MNGARVCNFEAEPKIKKHMKEAVNRDSLPSWQYWLGAQKINQHPLVTDVKGQCPWPFG